MNGSGLQRWAISALAALAVLYCLVVLWYVPTQFSLPLGCLLTNTESEGTPPRGLEIRDVSLLKGLDGKIRGITPEVGDHIIAAAGRPIRSFADWVRLHRDLRSWKIDSAARISFGKDPTEDSALSNLAVFEYPDKSRVVVVWFLRPGSPKPLQACLPLVGQPIFSVSATLLWFVLELCVLIMGAVAYWNRPFDQPLRTFVALSALTLVAFVGGSHWWLIAGNPWLTIIFSVAGTLLPAVLLHFFLVYPYPVSWYADNQPASTRLLYLIPGLAAAGLSVMILATSILSGEHGNGPFAQTIARLTGETAAAIVPRLRSSIYLVFGIGVTYFLLSLLAIRRSLQVARNPFERNQVRSLLWAALAATALITYTMYLAVTDQVEFALGAARLPMFGASLAFMLAYAIGIARYKLLLIDQVVSKGAWYYFASAGLALIFSALIAIGAMHALHQDLSLFGQTAPLILVLMTAVLILIWVRDSLQRNLDRRFFSEKYQLDKALNRMNRVVSSVLEPEAVADSLLTSCQEILQVQHVTLYLRKGVRMDFRMFTARGRGDLPQQITLDAEVFESLTQDLVLQRVAHSATPAQQLLRTLKSEVIYGLEMQGQLGGLLALGAKPNNLHFSAEDLAFVGAMGRISGVALHCATVQQDVTRLNQDLQLKLGKIEDQERKLSVLQNELATLSKLPTPSAVETEFRREGIRGNSPAILSVLETVRKVASSESSVLIRGESGTGKELLARSIHENSPRRNGPLVAVHCAALSPTLLESELFGHVKGAFTDARQDKPGRFQLANGGTLFLDEIGDISLDVQVKLLRVLQERVFEPVGSTQTVPADVRIVTATHRNLEQLIASGRFREDLFYRLNVISITLPPLRDRQEDLYELAVHFLRRSSAKSSKSVLHINDEAMKCLHNYHWQGNIRELENVIERAVVLAEGTSIRVEDLPVEIREAPPWPQASGESPRPAVESLVSRTGQLAVRRKSLNKQDDERRALVAALDECGGNKAEAARLLGIPRSTFFSKLKKHGLG
ncbi:sigma-54 interaction domain-containing protein [Planctomicrobium piriforme]|uniref:Regulatory protein, Fis family n=1 Tax=Planctomicrobium piriforme TaxID=1576369 RepID=A0A1I3DAQ3_9PLAN|nr:sigma-54 dependent transcriptional regulator [Planctomicrobium piriforme]SFH83804.1 regulatory protein, Fis family [Planctomicrobium piriforme]